MKRLLLTVLPAILLCVPVNAQVSVRPAALYLTPERSDADIALSSASGTTMELRFAAASQAESAAAESGAGPCTDWCVLTPQELQLTPDRPATLHVRVTPPRGIPDGEYHTFVLIRENDVVRERIPVHFRVGEVYSDVKLANVGVERSKEDVRFQFYLRQLGNAAYRGILQLRIENDRKKTIFSSTDRVDVYGAKTLEYVLPAGKVRKGTYRLYLDFNSDREDLGEHAIPVLPKKFSVEISMS